MLQGAATVDVEEFFHASALEVVAPRERWGVMPSRVVESTQRVLDLFSRSETKGTFFILGVVAERHPSLVREIAGRGHEIASHGYAHYRVGHQTPRVFRDDVERAKKILEDVCGLEVGGYRAASFSINRQTWWAFEELAEAGYHYSSSVYPIRHDHYGETSAPRHPFEPIKGFAEIPITTVRMLGNNLPAGGGGYFRLLPYRLSRLALKRGDGGRSWPAVNYFHPWEFDPGQPRLPVPLATRFRHYVNLNRMEAKVERLFRDFAWGRMDQAFASAIRWTQAPVIHAGV